MPKKNNKKNQKREPVGTLPSSLADPEPPSLSLEEVADLLRTVNAGSVEDPDEDRRTHADSLLEVARLLRSQTAKSPGLDTLIQTLADSARELTWRLPLGDSGILEHALNLLHGSKSLPVPVRIQILRLVGNCCADADENRERVLASGRLTTLFGQLDDDETVSFALHVLYNTLADYEPVQIKAIEEGLGTYLTDILAGPRPPDPFPVVPYVCRILALLASQDLELARDGALTTAVTLLSLASKEEEAAAFSAPASVALAYLTDSRISDKLAASRTSVTTFLDAFHTACTPLHAFPDAPDAPDTTDTDVSSAAELTAELKRNRAIFLKTLADFSGLNQFAAAHPLGCPTQLTLQAWLRQPNPLLQGAACMALGNLARSDPSSLALVETAQIHLSAIAILSDPVDSDGQLLHSALSMLKNLAIPPANKLTLASAGLLEPAILPRIWSTHLVPEVQLAAVTLCRLLVTGCQPNVSALCHATGPPTADPTDPNTYLQSVVALFLRSDTDPVKVEAARIIAAVCRVLHTSDPAPSPTHDPDLGEPDRVALYAQHPLLAQPLAFLAAQSKFPSLRTELWFLLALMSRSRDGALVALHVLDDDAARAALRAATATAIAPLEQTSESAPAAILGPQADSAPVSEPIADDSEHKSDQPATAPTTGALASTAPVEAQVLERARVDRTNCLGLIAGMVREVGKEMAPELRTELETILR